MNFLFCVLLMALSLAENMVEEMNVGMAANSGEAYCESEDMLTNQVGCQASTCCEWNTQEAGEASNYGAGRCWSAIEQDVCTDAPVDASLLFLSRARQIRDCTGCVSEFKTAGGCDTFDDEEKMISLIPAGCDHCGGEAAAECDWPSTDLPGARDCTEDQDCIDFFDGSMHYWCASDSKCHSVKGFCQPDIVADTCLTTSDTPCVFPFIYEGVSYNSCTAVDDNSNRHWCATSVSESGEYVFRKWGNCNMETCSETPNPTVMDSCVEGEGDCDNDWECKGDLICGRNNFRKKYHKTLTDTKWKVDACTATIECETDSQCVEKFEDKHFCAADGKCHRVDDYCSKAKLVDNTFVCQEGEGDCDSDSDCAPGLVCGPDFSFSTYHPDVIGYANADACIPPAQILKASVSADVDMGASADVAVGASGEVAVAGLAAKSEDILKVTCGPYLEKYHGRYDSEGFATCNKKIFILSGGYEDVSCWADKEAGTLFSTSNPDGTCDCSVGKVLMTDGRCHDVICTETETGAGCRQCVDPLTTNLECAECHDGHILVDGNCLATTEYILKVTCGPYREDYHGIYDPKGYATCNQNIATKINSGSPSLGSIEDVFCWADKEAGTLFSTSNPDGTCDCYVGKALMKDGKCHDVICTETETGAGCRQCVDPLTTNLECAECHDGYILVDGNCLIIKFHENAVYEKELAQLQEEKEVGASASTVSNRNHLFNLYSGALFGMGAVCFTYYMVKRGKDSKTDFLLMEEEL